MGMLLVLFHALSPILVSAALHVGGSSVGSKSNLPISVPAIMKHLEAFADVAESHGGSRSVTLGYNASAEYVINELKKVDFYDVELQPFTAPVYDELSPPSLQILGVDPALELNRCQQVTGWQHYYVGCDYAGVRYGGSGKYDVTASVQYIEDACSAAGWSAFMAGDIALVEASSACDYYTRGILGQDHKAGAIIFMSLEGSNSYPGSRVYDSATWPHKLVKTPCIGVTHAIGQLLKQQGVRATVKTNTVVTVANTFNVIATSRNGNPDEVVMMGSHLDSVPEGPGLNDNGSGSASTLEIALQWAAHQKAHSSPNDQPRVRFGWWGAEEIGLVGSRAYVDQLVAEPTELKKVQCYLNYDMEAGPNFVRQVHDASTAPVKSTIPGSKVLQHLYEQAWKEEGLSFALTGMSGGSDFLPFNLAGIPTGGLATGASGKKTEEERRKHGGLANTQLDPCYHAPCDTIGNIDQNCLLETATVSANVLERLVKGMRHSEKRAFNIGMQQNLTRRQEEYSAAKNDPTIKRRFTDDCNENPEGEKEGRQPYYV